MLEMVLTTVPLLFVLISVIEMSIGMWQYHTLAGTVNSVIRTAAVHGAGCAGQTCATTVDTVSRAIAGKAIGVPPGSMNVTLTSSASTVNCNPVSNCYGNNNYWPSLSGNTATSTDISISASYQFTPPIVLWFTGSRQVRFGTVTFSANATQPVIY
jgi:hypothetical protein